MTKMTVCTKKRTIYCFVQKAQQCFKNQKVVTVEMDLDFCQKAKCLIQRNDEKVKFTLCMHVDDILHCGCLLFDDEFKKEMRNHPATNIFGYFDKLPLLENKSTLYPQDCPHRPLPPQQYRTITYHPYTHSSSLPIFSKCGHLTVTVMECSL